MSIAAQPLTYEALRGLPDLGERYELIDGEVIVPPAPTTIHQRLVTRLSGLLLDAVRPLGHQDFLFYAPFDVVLSVARSVQPDLIYVNPAREGVVTDDNIVGAPDLVMEVLSPSSQNHDRRRKRQLYAEAGLAEYWVIDPRARTVALLVLAANGYAAALPGPTGLHSVALPGLVIDPAALFAGL